METAASNQAEYGQCLAGKTDGSQCHLKTFSRTQGFIPIDSLSAEDQLLITLRGGFHTQLDSVLCHHHQVVLLAKYEFLQKYCCNPFKLHQEKVKKGLSPVDIDTANKINEGQTKDSLQIKPGQKLCPTCRKELAKREAKSSTDSGDSEPSCELKVKVETEKVNTSFTAVGISPLKLPRVSKRDLPGYTRRKLTETQDVMTEKLATVSGLDPHELQSPKVEKMCKGCEDYKTFLEELKAKIQVSKHSEKLQLLTLTPQSWTIEQLSTALDQEWFKSPEAPFLWSCVSHLICGFSNSEKEDSES